MVASSLAPACELRSPSRSGSLCFRSARASLGRVAFVIVKVVVTKEMRVGRRLLPGARPLLFVGRVSCHYITLLL